MYKDIILTKRLERYNTIKQLPQFLFMQDVVVVDWFYKWFEGKIYKEIDFVVNPEWDESTDGIVTTYEVIIFDEETTVTEDRRVIDRRIVEAKHLQLK
jgi:hypothetical protein